ncbi:NADH:flavin oxidoreductase [Sphaerochaeta pleomorpha str. Grapes]|uniref:NADH:flavin oxidoreductase n=1 Tax=Sphaerochaeta pleomorpha (strain ATCC BAA-1885 / DSM 22778 / Grapes) TaxID=158190 RepID=G8QUW9_SPHPG|nr:NADH:flavin oxidoreductase [Sphaerochaeta pleomorpha]AEV28145.1 NADH:flavin oxidoreductase [Sphaerochaeta pleomorpha str. Grapes]
MNRFSFKNSDALREQIQELHLDIEYTEDLSPLHRTVKIGNKLCQNSFAILPMEGCDSNSDGSPSSLVYRRYRRFAQGGAGLIWAEANAVVTEGKANPNQMQLTQENLASFKDLVTETRKAGRDANGYEPVIILQLTHSGRYCRPTGHKPSPMVPQRDPILDGRTGVVSDDQIVSDAYLDSLIPYYVHSALLAKEAGFDGVDIKACHRYLISELLASHTRAGKYGGSFENRTRFLLTVIEEVRKALGKDFIVASRFNVFDAHPYPYGFGCDHEDMWKFDSSESERLVTAMIEKGVDLLSNSAGNPYYLYPQVTRPFDISSLGIPEPEEHQLVSIERLFHFSETVQKIAGDIPVVGNGYSWLRQFIPNIGAANLRKGSVKFIGLGRCAFAYPDAPRDVLLTGKMDSDKVCISCSKCTQIMRDHGTTGCVIRDSEIYAPLAKQFTQERIAREGK